MMQSLAARPKSPTTLNGLSAKEQAGGDAYHDDRGRIGDT